MPANGGRLMAEDYVIGGEEIMIEGEASDIVEVLDDIFRQVAAKARALGASQEETRISTILEILRVGALHHEYVEGLLGRIYGGADSKWREGTESFPRSCEMLIARRLSDTDPVQL